MADDAHAGAGRQALERAVGGSVVDEDQGVGEAEPLDPRMELVDAVHLVADRDHDVERARHGRARVHHK